MNTDWHDTLRGLIDRMPDTPEATPEAEATPESPAQRGALAVYVERKGRGGKVATIVAGFTIPEEQVADIAAALKKRLGVGGSSRGGEILIQGERDRQVIEALRLMGYKATRH